MLLVPVGVGAFGGLDGVAYGAGGFGVGAGAFAPGAYGGFG